MSTTRIRRLALSTVLLLALAACAESADDTGVEPLPVTDPQAIAALLAGSDRPVILNIWASWCVPCRSEAPLLERAWKQSGDRIRFVGINVADTQQGARAFLSEFDLPFEHYFDAPRSVPGSLGGSGVPLTFFFAPGGELVFYQPGVIDERTLALQIDELLRR